MEDKIVLNESACAEEAKIETQGEITQEKLPEIRPRKQKNAYKAKLCKVISYDEIAHSLDISFDGYGVRIKNVSNFRGDEVVVKYKGEIGKPKFEYKL